MGGGILVSVGAFPDVCVACLEGVPGKNGARKSPNCANRRGSVFGSGLARKSLDFGPTPKSVISGDILGDIRKSGFRDLVRMSYGGVY